MTPIWGLRKHISDEFSVVRTLEACLSMTRKKIIFKFTWNNTLRNLTLYHWSTYGSDIIISPQMESEIYSSFVSFISYCKSDSSVKFIKVWWYMSLICSTFFTYHISQSLGQGSCQESWGSIPGENTLLIQIIFYRWLEFATFRNLDELPL